MLLTIVTDLYYISITLKLVLHIKCTILSGHTILLIHKDNNFTISNL